MDIFGLVTVPIWVPGVLALPAALCLYSYYEYSKLRRLGYTGPTPIPLLGNLVEIGRKGFAPALEEWVKKYGDIFCTYTGHIPNLVIADLDMIQEICIRDFPQFMNRPSVVEQSEPMCSALSVVGGSHWKFMRSVLSPTFSGGKLRRMLPAIYDVNDNLVQHFSEKAKDGKSFDVKMVFAAYTMDIIAATAFGIQVDSLKNPDDPFVQQGKKLMGGNRLTSPVLLLVLMFPWVSKIFSRMGIQLLPKEPLNFFLSVTKTAIEDRKKEKSDRTDFLQLMMNAHKESKPDAEGGDVTGEEQDFDHFKERGLTENEILGNSLIFFLAGYDTTSNALSFSAYFLATNPDLQDKVIAEVDSVVGKERPTYEVLKDLKYMEMFMEETLRIYPIAIATNRWTEDDVTLNGYPIPKKVSILIPVVSIHHNPKYWPNPEKFDPERFSPENKIKQHPMAYQPFGAGPRNCVGMRMAQMESKMALVSILQKFRFETAPDTEIPPILDKTALTRAKNGIFLRLVPR